MLTTTIQLLCRQVAQFSNFSAQLVHFVKPPFQRGKVNGAVAGRM